VVRIDAAESNTVMGNNGVMGRSGKGFGGSGAALLGTLVDLAVMALITYRMKCSSNTVSREIFSYLQPQIRSKFPVCRLAQL